MEVDYENGMLYMEFQRKLWDSDGKVIDLERIVRVAHPPSGHPMMHTPETTPQGSEVPLNDIRYQCRVAKS